MVFSSSKFTSGPDGTPDRTRIGTLSGWVGILCNGLLFAAKLFAGIVSGSVSVTADALNNLSDAASSLVTLAGFRLAGKPADRTHPFGHARYEYLAGLAVAVMILFIGLELARSSVGKILDPGTVDFSAAAAAVLVISIVLKLWLSRFNRKLGRLIRSDALLAAAADSRNDCIATLAVLISGLLERYTRLHTDGILGLCVAVFILFSGFGLAKKTVSSLLGEHPDPALEQALLHYISSQPKVLGYHDLLVHDYGPQHRFATIHVEMDHREDPLLCHTLIDRMEHGCLRKFGVHLVIHHDPVITDDPELTRLKELLSRWLQQYDPRLSLHDFRSVPGTGHTNLLFDVTLPPELADSKAAITGFLQQQLESTCPEPYHLLITYELFSFRE